MSINGYRIPSDYKNDVSKYTHGWKSPAYFTMHPGLAYVTHHRHLNAGDRVRGRISQLVQSQPMVGPLMQGFRMITFATFTPDSLLYGWMRNGIRYTPEEWSKFDKYTFSPVFPSAGSQTQNLAFFAADPSVDTEPSDASVAAFYLHSGIAASYDDGYDNSSTFYSVWNTPTYVKASSEEQSSLHFSDNYFCAVGRGGLYDCMGIAPGAVPPRVIVSGTTLSTPPEWSFDVAPFVSYFLSVYYYLANMQEKYMYYSRGAYSLTFDNGSTIVPNVSSGRVTNLGFHEALCGFDPDDFLKAISSLAYMTNSGNTKYMNLFAGYWNAYISQSFRAWLLMGAQAHGGLFSVPYRPDFFNNIIKVGDSPSVEIPVVESTDDGGTGYSVAIPDLRFYNKVQNTMDRIFVGAGRFGDQLRTLFGTNSNPYTNKPDFLGIWQASLNPTNTVAMASGTNSDGASSTTGQTAARMASSSDFGGRSIDYYAKESGTVMFISFLVPMPAYSQGLHPDMISNSFADDFNPEYKGMGFQSVPRWRYSVLPDSFTDSPFVSGSAAVSPNQTVVGDTVAYDWLKTDYPRLHGEFASGGYFSYWCLDRRFVDYWQNYDSSTGEVTDVSVGAYYGTYINPLSWQYIFTTQSLLDPNFFVGFNFDLKVTSSVPANYMPYIGR